jgi:drug/metabolite transporter (DMT)-like permease
MEAQKLFKKSSTKTLKRKILKDNETKGMFFGLIGVMAFGLTLPMTKILIPYLDPIFIGLGRSSVATVFAIFILLKFSDTIPNKKQFLQLFFIAIGIVIGFPIFSAIAMQTVPASHGAIVIGILPLATAIAGVLITKERPSVAFWVVGLVGSLLVITYALLQGGGSLHKADFALFIAILTASFGYSMGGKLSKELGGWQVICWALVVSFPFIIIPTINYAPDNLAGIPISAYFSFIYLALISQLFGFFAWNKGLALGGIARVSQIQLLQTFITLIASVLILNEHIDMQMIIFTVLVVSSVWIGKKMPIKV